MQSPASKTATFRCSLNGLVSKEAPDLLRDGQYRNLTNVCSNQEGSISSRTGPKQVGALTSGEKQCYVIRKMTVQGGEDPLVPSLNPRYLGVLTNTNHRNIYRSLDYNASTLVATDVDTSAAEHWEMAPYSAGSSGAPWAYFACPAAMLKDSGLNPFGTLPGWGIPAAVGVVLAAPIIGTIGVSAVSDSLPTWPYVVIKLTSAAGLSDFDNVTFTGSAFAVTTTDGRTDLVAGSPWAVRVGIPDVDDNIVNDGTQFRIFDSNGQAVTSVAVYGGGTSVAGVPSPGNLDGGAESSPNNTQPYDWIITYKETTTGDQGNPSQLMSANGTASVATGGMTYLCNPVAIHGGQVSLLIWGTGDARIGTIRVFRRGGTLSDMVGRLIAEIANPGNEAYTIITDNMADADLVLLEQWQNDNDPPITSTPQSPIKGTSTGPITAGFFTVTLAGAPPLSSAILPAGTLAHITDNAGTSEDVYIESVPSSTTVRAYFQFAHNTGVVFEVDSISGQPCNLVAIVGESIMVAGDPNNPQTLYKNKNGYPQSFPVGTDAAGAVTSVNVGSPSNGILGLTECRGQVLCLNVSAIYEVPVLNGSLYTPNQVSGKGLASQSAWGKSESEEVWWLTNDDGIWSWDGASSRKRSEMIDPIFHGEQINGIPPISTVAADLQAVRISIRRGVVRFLYKNTAGSITELVCEPRYGDRWYQASEGPGAFALTEMYREPDTNSLILAALGNSNSAQFGIADVTVIVAGANQTSDWWSGTVASGNPIAWDIRLPWFDMGEPAEMKLFEEAWLELDAQIFVGTSSITVELLLDYSDTAVDTFNIAIPSGSSFTGRNLVSLLPNLVNTSGGTYQSYGREARAISFHLSGSAFPTQVQLFRVIFQYQDTGLASSGGASDWMDLGSKHDKRLYQMTVVFDTAGTDRQLVLETLGGRDGKTAGTPQVFNLSSPTPVAYPGVFGPGARRCMKVLPMADPTIAKLMRVRPVSPAPLAGVDQSTTDLWRILEVIFPDAEQYPPDVVTVAGSCSGGKVTEPWTAGGYEYDKYANQIDFEVNTNNVAVVVQLQADGANIGSTFTIQSTESDRRRNITLPAGLIGKQWRIWVDPSQTAIFTGAGMFQLFSLSWKFEPADKGQVGHTFDYDDLGHPYDKLLETVTIEYDISIGGAVTLQMDTLTGIAGATANANVAQFRLLGPGRGKVTFPLAPDTIVKMIRLYPVGTVPIGFKQWKYYFKFTPYPPDIVEVVPWKDASSPDDKDPSWLWIDADTAGIAASVILASENGAVMTVQHTGTTTNRKKNYPVPPDTHAKMWRILPTPGTNGKFQMWEWGFARWAPFDSAGPIDPPEVILATPWNDFGWPYPKLGRNLILTINTGGVPATIALQTQEAGTVQVFRVNTTFTTRRVVIACNPNLAGSQWRLILTPGAGGLAQLWNWSLDTIKEPPAVTQWTFYAHSLGYAGFKLLFQLWVDYVCAVPVNVTFTSSTGTFTKQFPAQPRRGSGPQRLYFPSVFPPGLNLSVLYDISITSADGSTTFQLYADSSSLEWLPFGADRHAGFKSTVLSEFAQIPI